MVSEPVGNGTKSQTPSIVALVLFVAVAVLGALYYSGRIGHWTMPWPEFKDSFSAGDFNEVRFSGKKVTATFHDDPKRAPVVLESPADPLPETEKKWFIVRAMKHGTRLVFENPADPEHPEQY